MLRGGEGLFRSGDSMLYEGKQQIDWYRIRSLLVSDPVMVTQGCRDNPIDVGAYLVKSNLKVLASGLIFESSTFH